MQLIFLDIDGVLNNQIHLVPSNKHEDLEFDPSAIMNLKLVLTETKAKIVISSTWRLGRSIDELNELFKHYEINDVIIGKTPVLERTTYGERGLEIQSWIDNNRDKYKIGSFIIIDDDNDMNHLIDRLIYVDRYYGLREVDARKAIEMLRGE